MSKINQSNSIGAACVEHAKEVRSILFFGGLAFLLLIPLSCASRKHATSGKGKAACCATNLASSTSFIDASIYQLESTWTNDFGQAMKLDGLHTRVQVVTMFFASCTYACPIIVEDLKRIERELPKGLGGKVGFTLVTIDTARDTVDALHAFRASRKLPPDRWTLLRGNQDDTLELAALLGVKFKREATGQFAHSNLITVLNEQGEIIHQVAGLKQDVADILKQIEKSLAKNTSPSIAPVK